jgi:hypothetical protein
MTSHRCRGLVRGGVVVLGLAWLALLAGAEPKSGAKEGVVYRADFEDRVGPEWSVSKTEVTPKGRRRFLGRLGNETVRLTLRDLPPHRFLRVSFELFIIASWDGAGKMGGADVWRLWVEGGPRLVDCTFAEYPAPDAGRQTFPDDYPGPRHERRTGAAEVATLGYVHQGGQTCHDGVYRLSFAFPHAAREVTFAFAGEGLQDPSDESWGLDNVRVEVLPGPRRLGEAQLAAHWKALHGDDPVAAFRARWALVAAGDQAADYLAARLRPPKLDEAEIRRLVAALDADRWADREAAAGKLRQLGQAAAPVLRESLKGKCGEEARSRIEALLAAARRVSMPGEQRAPYTRTLRLLEVIGSEAAIRALEELWRHGPAADVQAEALAAGRRVASRRMDGLAAEALAETRRLRFDAARGLYARAEVARLVGSPAEADAMGAAQKRVDALAAVYKGLAALTTRLEAHPDNRAVREQLIRTYVVELDSPGAAAKILDERCGEAWRRHVPLAARPVDEVETADLRRLALWYRGLYLAAGEAGKPAMRRRALGYYRAYVRRMRKAAAEAEADAAELEADPAAPVSGAAADLLGRARPKTQPVVGQWQRVGPALHVASGEMCRLPIPVAPIGDYELVADVLRKKATDKAEVNFMLPVAGTGVMLTLLGPEGTVQLQNVDGREQDLPPKGGVRLTNHTLHRLRVTVRRRGDDVELRASLDGRELMRWRGPPRSLALNPHWGVWHGEVIGLGAHQAEVEFHQLRLRMLTGRWKTVKLPDVPRGPLNPIFLRTGETVKILHIRR